jgi:hypothetical protein
MLTITSITQPDPTNNPQLLKVSCSSTGQLKAPYTVKCWADLDDVEVTSHVEATDEGDGVYVATLNLLELGSNYYANTTYTITAQDNAGSVEQNYTTDP